jgi:hypothetical protein
MLTPWHELGKAMEAAGTQQPDWNAFLHWLRWNCYVAYSTMTEHSGDALKQIYEAWVDSASKQRKSDG